MADALAAARREERAEDAGEYHSIAARASESSTLDFGPLFNPDAFAAGTEAPAPSEDAIRGEAAIVAEVDENERAVVAQSERRETLRKTIARRRDRASAGNGERGIVEPDMDGRGGGADASTGWRK